MARLIPNRKIQLGSNLVPVPRIRLQSRAQHPLRLTGPILIRRIEQRNPAIERRMNAARRLFPTYAPSNGQPGSKAQLGNLQRPVP